MAMRIGSPLVLNGMPDYVPWQVSIVDTYSNMHICGGAILNSFVILTAAHCLIRNGRIANNQDPKKRYWRKSNELRIVAGQYSLQWKDPTEQINQVDSIIFPRGFNDTTLEHDFVLLFLKNEFRFNEKVKTIPLPSHGRIFKGNMTVSGWGLKGTLPGNVIDRSDILRSTHLKIISNEACQKYYPGGKDTIFPTMFCGTSHSSNTCSGDSGSPATCEEETVYIDPPQIKKRTVLCGIVSWGKGKCEVNSDGSIQGNLLPSVFTQVSSYIPHLYRYIEEETSKDKFLCHNLQVIPKSQVCDFKQDCEDGSDEYNCSPFHASTSTTTESSVSLTKTNPHPSQVSLVDTRSETEFCKGNIINSRIISLTKLSCLFETEDPTERRKDDEIRIVVGGSNGTETESHQVLKSYIPNNPSWNDNVIAYMVLNSSISFNEHVKDVQLAKRRQEFNQFFDWLFKEMRDKVPGKFICHSDLQVLDEERKCNSIPDCADSSDELDCTAEMETTTMTMETMTDYNYTISSSPTEAHDQFQCGDLTNIPIIKRCDGNKDCQDGWDEEHCGETTNNGTENAMRDDIEVTPCTTCIDGGRNELHGKSLKHNVSSTS